MAESEKQFQVLIEQILTEKTFNLEIVEKIKELRDGFAKSQEEVNSLEEQLGGYRKRLDEANDSLQKCEKKLEKYEKQKIDLLKREKEADKKDYMLEMERQRADEIKELVALIFKSPVARTNINRNRGVVVPSSGGNHYISNVSDSETIDEEIQ